jgi:hypothetical protein
LRVKANLAWAINHFVVVPTTAKHYVNLRTGPSTMLRMTQGVNLRFEKKTPPLANGEDGGAK